MCTGACVGNTTGVEACMSSPQCEHNAILVNGYSIRIDVVCPVVTARLKLAYNEQAWQTRITNKGTTSDERQQLEGVMSHMRSTA